MQIVATHRQKAVRGEQVQYNRSDAPTFRIRHRRHGRCRAGRRHVSHAQEPTRAEADAMQTKIARVEAASRPSRRDRRMRRRCARHSPSARSTLTSRSKAPRFCRAGIAMPRARLGDDGRVQASARRRSRRRAALARAQRCSIRSAISQGPSKSWRPAESTAADGEGVIRYESATVGGVAVPKTVAQELLRFYTRTPGRPDGFAFDEPFDLPAGLRGVSVESGSVTVDAVRWI